MEGGTTGGFSVRNENGHWVATVFDGDYQNAIPEEEAVGERMSAKRLQCDTSIGDAKRSVWWSKVFGGSTAATEVNSDQLDHGRDPDRSAMCESDSQQQEQHIGVGTLVPDTEVGPPEVESDAAHGPSKLLEQSNGKDMDMSSTVVVPTDITFSSCQKQAQSNRRCIEGLLTDGNQQDEGSCELGNEVVKCDQVFKASCVSDKRADSRVRQNGGGGGSSLFHSDFVDYRNGDVEMLDGTSMVSSELSSKRQFDGCTSRKQQSKDVGDTARSGEVANSTGLGASAGCAEEQSDSDDLADSNSRNCVSEDEDEFAQVHADKEMFELYQDYANHQHARKMVEDQEAEIYLASRHRHMITDDFEEEEDCSSDEDQESTAARTTESESGALAVSSAALLFKEAPRLLYPHSKSSADISRTKALERKRRRRRRMMEKAKEKHRSKRAAHSTAAARHEAVYGLSGPWGFDDDDEDADRSCFDQSLLNRFKVDYQALEKKFKAQADEVSLIVEENRSPFVGLGYSANPAKLRAARDVVPPPARLSGGERRLALKPFNTSLGEEFCMAIEPFGKNNFKSKIFSSALKDSFVEFVKTESAIDSGASVTIAQMDTHLEQFCTSKSIPIRAFNNAVTRSSGSGIIYGYVKDDSGNDILLSVPNSHKVGEASMDLISASSLVDNNYAFMLRKSDSFLLTPDWTRVPLQRKHGLFWLTWYKAVDVKSRRKRGDQKLITENRAHSVATDQSNGAASSSSEGGDVSAVIEGSEDEQLQEATAKCFAGDSESYLANLSVPGYDSELDLDQPESMLNLQDLCHISGIDAFHCFDPGGGSVGAAECLEECSLCHGTTGTGFRNDDVGATVRSAGHSAEPYSIGLELQCGLCNFSCDDDDDMAAAEVDDLESNLPCCSADEVESSCYCMTARGKSRTPTVSLRLLHQRMGHCNPAYLKTMFRQQRLDVSLEGKAKEVRCCDACRSSKATRHNPPASRETEPTPTKPFESVFSDIKGKLKGDFWGNRYLVVFACEVTRWTAVYFCRKKSQVVDRFRDFLRWVALHDFKVSRLTTDGGGEFTGGENTVNKSEFERVCVENKIIQRFSAANTQAQNGISERLMRTLVDSAASMLHEAALDHRFWSLAVKHACWIRNRLSHDALRNDQKQYLSPFEKLFKKPVKISMVRVFGCDSWKFDHDRSKDRITNPKAVKGIFVGISPSRKGWIIFDTKSKSLRTSYHCSFNEDFTHRKDSLTGFKLRVKKAKLSASQEQELLSVAELYSDVPSEREFWRQSDPDFGEKGPKVNDCNQPSSGAKEGSNATSHTPKDNADPVKASGGGTDSSVKNSSHGDDSDGSESESNNSDDEEETPLRRRSKRKRTSNEVDQQAAGRPSSQRISGGISKYKTPLSGDEIVVVDEFGKDILFRDLIPPRKAERGVSQALTVEDVKFFKMAHNFDWKIEVWQTNPKSGKSHSRYEKYKHAETLREFLNFGGTWLDIENDFVKGYIEFDTSSTTTVRDLKQARFEAQDRETVGFAATLAKGSGAVVDDCSIRRAFGKIGADYLNGLSDEALVLARKALGRQSIEDFAFCCAARILIPEPISFQEAMRSKYAKEWKAAMDEELATLISFNCFERVKRADALKHGRLVKSKWVFKVKYNADGSLQRFKARLVGKGFTQVPGADFYETYSPVFSYTSLRTILARAAALDLQIDQWDLKSSFIQQDIDVDHLYMETPEGHSKVLDDGVTPAALHLKKSIYGLVQSSRLLHQRLSKFLKSKGFRQLVSDQCVFVKGSGSSEVIICTWVDDIIMASKRHNDSARKLFDIDIRSEFTVSPWTAGEAGWLLNMKVVRDWDRGILHISQEAAVEKLAQRFGLDQPREARPKIPMPKELKLNKPPPERVVPKSEFDYMSAVGGLLYIALTTRPDVAYSVGVLSRFMACPSMNHVELAKRVICYLYRTKEHGIQYSKNRPTEGLEAPHVTDAPIVYARYLGGKGIIDEDPEELLHNGTLYKRAVEKPVTYVDADLAGDVDTLRSTTGYAVMMSGGIISWLSKLQPTVALSTAEAETNAATELVKQLSHTRLFLRELNCPQDYPTIVYEDNMATIQQVGNSESGKRAKHYLMKVHYLREQKDSGSFEMRHLKTGDQLADVFTKALPDGIFQKFRSWMGVLPPLK